MLMATMKKDEATEDPKMIREEATNDHKVVLVQYKYHHGESSQVSSIPRERGQSDSRITNHQESQEKDCA